MPPSKADFISGSNAMASRLNKSINDQDCPFFFFKTRQLILCWKRTFTTGVLKQSKDKDKDKDKEKDKEEERLEFYSQLANCWWVGGGKSLTCGGLLIQHCIIDCTTPHTHYNTEHKTNFTQNIAIHNLHTEHKTEHHRTEQYRTEHIAAHFPTVVGGKPGPRDRSRLSTIFIQTHFILLLALYLELWKHSCKLFLVKKGEKRQNKSFGVMKFRSRQQQQQQPLWVCARSTGSTPLHSTDW